MKAKNFLIVFAVILIAMSFFACDIFTTSKIGKDTDPKPKTITVKYARILPVLHPDYPDEITLNWYYEPSQGGACDVPKIAEDTFSISGIGIMTETRITICVRDPRHYNGSSDQMCQYLYIDGQELSVSSQRGQTIFIYGNDGKIRYPGT